MIFNRDVLLVDKQALLPDLLHMTFRSKEIAEYSQPGNFIQIRINPGLDPFFRRPMSIHNCSGDHFEMIFRIVGKGTGLLARSREGDIFDVIGPLGNSFERPQKEEHAIFISGGIGFPPLHFFAKSLLEKDSFPASQMLFLFGIKSLDEKAMAQDILSLGIETLFSTDDGSDGFKGVVTALFEDVYARRLRNRKIRIYACGPTAMLQKISQLALGFKLPCQLSLEGNMPCGVGTCLGCAVKKRGIDDYLRVCREGPIFNVHEVEL